MCGESVRVSRREFKDELVKLYLESRASKTVSQVARRERCRRGDWAVLGQGVRGGAS